MSEILPIGAHVYGLPLDIETVNDRRAKGIVTGGAALVVGLLMGVDDAGVDRRSGWRVTKLLTEDGRVVGVEATDGDPRHRSVRVAESCWPRVASSGTPS